MARTGQSMPSAVTDETYVADVEAAKRPPVAPRRPLPMGAVAAAFRRLPDAAMIVSPAVALAVMLWGLSARPYWGDEADTVSAVSRSVPQLFRLLGHIDAVHGLYYLLLWPVARVAGTGEFATRLPSAVAMAAAAAGVTAIGRRLASRQAGLCAGLMFAVLPTVTVQGHDARPYAMVTAAAVLASYLLVRAAQDPRRRWFAAYGLSLVLVGYAQLFGLLLVPAHAVTLIGLSRGAGRGADGGAGGVPRAVLLRRWLVTVAAAGVGVAPVTAAGWVQRAQIAWIPKPGWGDVGDLVATLTAGSVGAAAVIVLLAVLGGICAGSAAPAALRRLAPPGRADVRRTASSRPWAGATGQGLTWLAAPWLVLPPLILVAASVIQPVYFSRYLTYCLPAVALLAGAGLAAMRWPLRACALALVVALVAPTQLAMRAPGGGMQMVAQFLSAHRRPGDAIVYPEASIPPWYLAYPEGFAQLRDISMAETPAAAGRLFGDTVPLPVLQRREESVRRIWILPVPGTNPAPYLAPGFRLAHEWKLRGYQPVLLYTRTN
jgi:mannosyltransferase